jgi:hypothetical protein
MPRVYRKDPVRAARVNDEEAKLAIIRLQALASDLKKDVEGFEKLLRPVDEVTFNYIVNLARLLEVSPRKYAVDTWKAKIVKAQEMLKEHGNRTGELFPTVETKEEELDQELVSAPPAEYAPFIPTHTIQRIQAQVKAQTEAQVNANVSKLKPTNKPWPKPWPKLKLKPWLKLKPRLNSPSTRSREALMRSVPPSSSA